MQEHELKEYQRLRAEGLWSVASEFRETERRRLRAAGRNRQQARQESLEAMLDKYPPQEGQTPARQAAIDCRMAADADSDLDLDEQNRRAEIAAELEQLHLLTNGQPTDADRDIDFAYRNMGLSTVTPLLAPSGAAWCWYLYADKEPDKFLEICAKREDAKAKQAGTITYQRMEDDKRKQFDMIDRIRRQLTIEVHGMVDDLMSKFPEDVLNECRRHTEAWNAYFETYPEAKVWSKDHDSIPVDSSRRHDLLTRILPRPPPLRRVSDRG